MRKIYTLLLAFLISTGGTGAPVYAQVSADHKSQIAQLDYLLAVDRLDFYSDGLADYLMEHEQKLAAEAIRKIEPEDYAKEQFAGKDLNNPDKWNELILSVLHKKFPEFKNLTLQDIQWNYNFFRKKLMEGFKADPISLKKEASVSSLNNEPVQFNKRTIPKVDGKTILLDAERYISEKTTRALFWDAALSHKAIEFHLGTERDFRQRISQEEREVIAEVKTRAANYNKIYLVFNPHTKEYSYAFTRISGNDRVTHLMAQLGILKYQGQTALKNDSVRVYGNPNKVHRAQEERLSELFKTLPKADMVVIGQKSAIGNVIAMAGMMSQIQPDVGTAVGENKTQIQKLSQRVAETGSYFSVTSKASIVKTEFEKIPSPTAQNYEIFNSEQPSHDVSDVLLETKDGKIVRWRFISNMWGDEVVPVARAIKNSGHDKVVYIGTAGGIIGKGLKVGDVVAPSKTYTQDGRLLELEKPTYATDFVKTGMTLGQVTSPFDETQKWLKKWNNSIDLVELETGYLKDNLGSKVSFQPYLLISDVVGSEHESLAVAAADSGKRKNGQLKLLESLFINNGIKAPVSNFEMISAEPVVKAMYHKIDSLRASRDVTSKLQLTQLAIRKGLKTDAELEALIKAEPSFDRQMLMDKLEKFSGALEIIAKKVSGRSFAITGGDELLNGTWNPKKVLKLQMMVGNMSATEAKAAYAQELAKIESVMGKELQIEVLSYDAEKTREAVFFGSRSKKVLADHYEKNILKKLGLTKEIDKNGGVRFREVTESAGGMRCEAVLM
ncbi:hypothetical protein [Bdellovibrio reynosensis]|uniref:Nucleoside phosphorylase domain-containing protein n=1 Tax=Bdellovibrio reynosensis TaxID=2835041 RepID=A0ABY4CAV4_9BACT|nr:hypothetical protein [Bdellovibrio reynosensis]UOF01983.1 hypothetical protein MNR06_03320 [Bdellovibrio reynosensis]